jgi:hypothetical protein
MKQLHSRYDIRLLGEAKSRRVLRQTEIPFIMDAMPLAGFEHR